MGKSKKYPTMEYEGTIVVNIHKKKGIRPPFDIYIGRATRRKTEFKENSKWANKYSFKQYSLKALEYYEEEIRKKIKENPEYYNLEELRGKKLGCWCKANCHGLILLKLLKEKDFQKCILENDCKFCSDYDKKEIKGYCSKFQMEVNYADFH